MVRRLLPLAWVDENFHFRNKVNVDGVVRRINIANGRPAQADHLHRQLKNNDKGLEKVVIVIDGLGSSTATNSTSTLVGKLDSDVLGVCEFCYTGITVGRYERSDTVRHDLHEVVDFLDGHIRHHSQAKSIVLVGYSLGGLIASQWVHSHKEDTGNVTGLCLIASPIRLKASRVAAPTNCGEYPFGCQHLDTMLSQYTTDPEALHDILPMEVFRAEVDVLLSDNVYHFNDRQTSDRPTQHPPFANTDHWKILDDKYLHAKVVECVTKLG